MKRPVKPTPTNLYVLRTQFAAGPEIPNRVPAGTFHHVKRLALAGLLEVSADGRTLRLTPAGVVAFDAEVAAKAAGDAKWAAKAEAAKNAPCRFCAPKGLTKAQCETAFEIAADYVGAAMARMHHPAGVL